jgi:hypothetical protein
MYGVYIKDERLLGRRQKEGAGGKVIRGSDLDTHNGRCSETAGRDFVGGNESAFVAVVSCGGKGAGDDIRKMRNTKLPTAKKERRKGKEHGERNNPNHNYPSKSLYKRRRDVCSEQTNIRQI